MTNSFLRSSHLSIFCLEVTTFSSYAAYFELWGQVSIYGKLILSCFEKDELFWSQPIALQCCYPPRSVNGNEQLSEGLTNSQELPYHGQSIEERFDLLRWRKMSSSDAQVLLTNLSECQIKTLKGVKKRLHTMIPRSPAINTSVWGLNCTQKCTRKGQFYFTLLQYHQIKPQFLFLGSSHRRNRFVNPEISFT